ncbi:ZCHC7-like protein [Mya arenaria]|uniref:Zinc finger CCHC domain-containing protein 7 n=1 Tax=Mya arenaria TaxID=6604 RepID=A0ABY7DJK7_MYAAR|nr:zinc finger CCHC domain-containing protein 7-like [Mya arenaria]WAQ96887.1 ZCHC7-like protein [Mya arenaria]
MDNDFLDSFDDGQDKDSVGSDNDDEYAQEQMEIALYSQIHFEQNDECHQSMDSGIYEVSSEFCYDVISDGKTGFIAQDTTADLILNKSIEDKYGILLAYTNVVGDNLKKSVCLNDTNSSREEYNAFQANISVKKPNTVKVNTARKKPESSKINTTADKLIFGTEFGTDVSESLDGDIGALNMESSDQEDSDGDSVYGVLGNLESDDDKIQMNINQSTKLTRFATEFPVEAKWTINRADSGLEGRAVKGRYFKGGIRCYNCNTVGHLSKNCPQPKKESVCFLCSEAGHHNINCEEPGHDARKCPTPRRSLNNVCFRCNMYGHEQIKCPDIWRQYHLTTTPGKLRQQKILGGRDRSVSCYNCGDHGHYGHDCEEERMNWFLRIHTPFICRYQLERVFREDETKSLWEYTAESRCKRQQEGHDEYNRGLGGPQNKRIKFDSDDDDYDYGNTLSIEDKLENTDLRSVINELQHFRNLPGSQTNISEKSNKKRPMSSETCKSEKNIRTKKKNDIREKSNIKPVKEIGAKPHEKGNFLTPKAPSESKDKKVSKFVPFDKNRTDSLTGRNNFDNLQFKVQKENSDKKKKEKKVKKSKLKKESVIVAVEVNSGNDGEKEHGKSSVQVHTLKKKKKKSKKSDKSKHDEIIQDSLKSSSLDFSITFSQNQSSTRDKSERKVRKKSSAHNDLEDLFSIQKLQKVQSKLNEGEDVSEIQDDNDMDHQAYNNEWWDTPGGKKRKKRKKGKNKN